MAVSQNGWPVIESGTDPTLTRIDKIIGRVRAGDVADIFAYLVARFDAEVEDVDVGADDWGWAFRAIRGATSGYSNHASGTALDLNATRHVLGKRGTFTPAQQAAIRQILIALDDVVRWGGDYTGRPDEMHFEIVGTAAQVASVAARIRAGQLVSNPIGSPGAGPILPNPSAPLTPIDPEDDMPVTEQEMDRIAEKVAARVWNYTMQGGDDLPGTDTAVPLETAGERLRQVRRSTTGAYTELRRASERAYKGATRAGEVLDRIDAQDG